MATHSSIPAWRIPWTERSGRLQSTGLQELDITEAAWHARKPGIPVQMQIPGTGWTPDLSMCPRTVT